MGKTCITSKNDYLSSKNWGIFLIEDWIWPKGFESSWQQTNKGQAKLVDANQRMVFSKQLKWWCWSPTTALSLSPYETEKCFGVKSLSFPAANLPQLFRSAADGRYCWRHTTLRTPLLCLDVIAISIAGRGIWLALICVLVGWQKSD